MEQVLARLTSLVGHLLVSADDGIADGTLGLAFQRADDVLAENEEAVSDATILREGKLAYERD